MKIATRFWRWTRTRLRWLHREAWPRYRYKVEEHARAHQARALGCLALVAVVIALFVIWNVPQWQVDDTGLAAAKRIELEDKARNTILKMIGGTLALGAGVIAYLNYKVSEQGKITERFSKAIEMLGAKDGSEPSLEIRLGGIYALERIARDSGRDHSTVMEVLTAYVRQHAPRVAESDVREDDTANAADASAAASPNPNRSPRLRADIQSTLDIIGRRSEAHARRESRRLDLKQTV